MKRARKLDDFDRYHLITFTDYSFSALRCAITRELKLFEMPFREYTLASELPNEKHPFYRELVDTLADDRL